MSSRCLWAPWRLGYIANARKSAKGGCPFCRKRGRSKDHILTRGRTAFSVLNRFPYNNGHLLIAPYRHVGRLEALKREEWLEILDLTRDALLRLDLALRPHGYNLGINLGRVAGAGIPGHLHLHIVPRWIGDTNFMPVVAQTKVISQSLASAHQLLKQVRPSPPKKSRG